MNVFLKKHLQCFEEKNSYCSGRFVGSVENLVEGFIATTNMVYHRSSIHRRGKSKRFKSDNALSKSKVLLNLINH